MGEGFTLDEQKQPLSAKLYRYNQNVPITEHCLTHLPSKRCCNYSIRNSQNVKLQLAVCFSCGCYVEVNPQTCSKYNQKNPSLKIEDGFFIFYLVSVLKIKIRRTNSSTATAVAATYVIAAALNTFFACFLLHCE